MIGLPFVYAVAGAMFAGFAAVGVARRRWGNAAFWALVALSMVAGDRLGDTGNGVLVLALAAAGLAMRRAGDDAPPPPARGNGLFLVALVIPAVAVAGTFGFRALPALVDPKQATLVALACGVLIALAIAVAWLRPRPAEPIEAGLALADAVGWAALLPQALAALGAVFAIAGVGGVVGGAIGGVLPVGSLVAAVLAYALGMAGLTMLLGNAFAAFPVMAAAVGVPLLVRVHHGDPAVVAALGMLCGFCGTLLTPMAANFNLVPVGLLDLPGRYAVIRAQAPTALILLAVNILLLLLGFPR